MCYPAPGPYCSAYANAIYQQSLEIYEKNSTEALRAAQEWFSTPRGLVDLKSLFLEGEDDKSFARVSEYLLSFRKKSISDYESSIHRSSLETFSRSGVSNIEVVQAIKQLSRFESGRHLLSEETDAYSQYPNRGQRLIEELRQKAETAAQKLSIYFMEMSDLDRNTEDYAGMKKFAVPEYHLFVKNRSGLLSQAKTAQLNTWRELAGIEHYYLPLFDQDKHFAEISPLVVRDQIQLFGIDTLLRTAPQR